VSRPEGLTHEYIEIPKKEKTSSVLKERKGLCGVMTGGRAWAAPLLTLFPG